MLSSDFSRDLSHSVKILPDAQGHNDGHGTRAAELPGICNVNLVSDTMGDGISPSAWSRCVSKPEKPTQCAPACAECPAPGRSALQECRWLASAGVFAAPKERVRQLARLAGVCRQATLPAVKLLFPPKQKSRVGNKLCSRTHRGAAGSARAACLRHPSARPGHVLRPWRLYLLYGEANRSLTLLTRALPGSACAVATPALCEWAWRRLRASSLQCARRDRDCASF